ncbi:adenosylcobinamide-phosphate synthase CbiB [Rhodoferax sp.]|uniref:adenosylcobinamide-phosphate synthase CbiB n=1 Tax=Rhodoferax sp. TaxID=50421 RepID=UPI0025CED1EA|nr:adenosylcobinamide-phosphate synthase CbiB [Rhodoferax sp.]
MPFTFSPLMSLGLGTLMFATALLLALAIDHCLGEPAARWHPVVWMGNYLGWTGRRLAPLAHATPAAAAKEAQTSPDLKRFWLGALMWCSGAAIVCVAAWALQEGLLTLPAVLGPLWGGVLAALGLGLALKPLLAWAMLRSEVLAVEAALNPTQGGSLAAGRERLSWLVSRDVTHLTEAQVRESAIETLAENLNDSVVAPIFWFVLLGLPGAALYRFANTADAMWGYPGVYQGRNWQWAGKWAARADDVLSWIPARITACLLVAVCWLQTLASTQPQPIDAVSTQHAGPEAAFVMARLPEEARRTPSPNSGWPMAAMALALDVSLHKPGVYVLNAAGRAPQPQDTRRAIVYASKVLLALVFIAQAAIIFVAVWRVA